MATGDSLQRRASRASLWSALEIGFRIGAQFLVTVVLARILAPGDFGTVATLVAITTYSALLADAGLSSSIVRGSTSEAAQSAIFAFNLGVALACAVLLSAFAPMVGRLLHLPALPELLEVAAWSIPVVALGTVSEARLTRDLDFRSRAIAEATAALVSTFVAIAAARRGYGVWSLVIQIMAAAGLRAVMLLVLARWWPRRAPSWSAFRAVSAFSGPLFLSTLIGAAGARIPVLAIGRLFGASDLGFYAIAQTTQAAPLTLVGSIMQRLGLPVFSALQADPARMERGFRFTLRLAQAVLAPTLAFLAINADAVLRLLYGEEWRGATMLLVVLCATGFFWPTHVLNLSLVAAVGETSRLPRMEMQKQLVVALSIAAGAPFGLLGVALGICLSSVPCAWINTRPTAGRFDYGLVAQVRDQMGIVLTALATAAAAALLARTLVDPGPLRLAASSLLFLVLHAAAVRVLHRDLWRDGIGVLLQGISRSTTVTR